jgi:hypothetical protein
MPVGMAGRARAAVAMPSARWWHSHDRQGAARSGGRALVTMGGCAGQVVRGKGSPTRPDIDRVVKPGAVGVVRRW